MRQLALGWLLACGLVASATAQRLPSIAPPQQFGDWIVGCDNSRHCEAVGLRSDDQPRANSIAIVMTRSGEAASLISLVIRIIPPEGEAARQVGELRTDARVVDAAFTQMGDQVLFNEAPEITLAALRQLARGNMLTALDPSGAVIGAASLKGLPKALAHIDVLQRRVQTTTAIIEPGVLEWKAPVFEPLASVRVPPASAAPPPRGAEAELLNTQKGFACRRPSPPSSLPRQPRLDRLDDRTSVAVLRTLCEFDAHNDYRHLALIDNDGRVREAKFDVSGSLRESGALSNAWWDGEAHRLRLFYKSRGLGDCGVSHQYAWDGVMFRLVEKREMPICAGSLHFVRTYHRRVEQQ
jgi:hypothetical protein